MNRLALGLVLIWALAPAQAADSRDKQTKEKRITDAIAEVNLNKDKHPEQSAVACARALSIDRSSGVALSCVDVVKPKEPEIKQSIATAAGVGRIGTAVEWCRAYLTVNPTSALTADCTTIETRWQKIQRAQIDLKQAEGYVSAGDSENAMKLVTGANVTGSESPEVLRKAVDLMSKIGTSRIPPKVRLGLTYASLNQADQATNTCSPLIDTDPDNALECVRVAGILRQHLQQEKDLASLEIAADEVSDGDLVSARRDALAVRMSTTNPETRRRASAILDQTQTGGLAGFLRAMRAPWVWTTLGTAAALLITWFGLRILRFVKRKIVKGWTRLSRTPRWMFGEVKDDANLGAKDPILDALRRMPNEVRLPIWTPTRLWLDSSDDSDGCRVLEDIGVTAAQQTKPLHETPFQKTFCNPKEVSPNGRFRRAMEFVNERASAFSVSTDNLGNAALVSAFENLQFNVGTVSVGNFAKVFGAVFTWWNSGSPTLSCAALQIPATQISAAPTQPVAGGAAAAAAGAAAQPTPAPANPPVVAQTVGNDIAVRLTCSTYDKTTTTIATTTVAPGIDALRVSAERAAYKLALSLLPRPKTDRSGEPNPQPGQDATAGTHDGREDTAEEIDAHAAFRQGAKSLSCLVRTVYDNDGDKKPEAQLNTTIDNLEFARQVFARDPGHEPYFFETLRMQAIAYAMLGRDKAALTRLEELENGASTSKRTDRRTRNEQLRIEALYNQAVLHLKIGMAKLKSDGAVTPDYVEFDIAGPLLDQIIEKDLGGITSLAAQGQKMRIYAAIPHAEWHRIPQTSVQVMQTIDNAASIPDQCEELSKASVGVQRRFLTTAAGRVRRSYAIARFSQIFNYNFPAPGRGPFEIGAESLPPGLREVIKSTVGCFERTKSMADAPVDVQANWAYGLLLLGKFRSAQRLAAMIVDDQTNSGQPVSEFAIYIAAEAAMQRGSRSDAIRFLQERPECPADPALCALIRDFGPIPAEPEDKGEGGDPADPKAKVAVA